MMTDNSKMALKLLAGGILLGIAGDLLFNTKAVGLNILLWMLALVVTLLYFSFRSERKFTGVGIGLLLSALFFASVFTWRASPTLIFLNCLALMLTIALVVMRGRSHQLPLAGWLEYLLCFFLTWLNAAFGFVLLILGDIKWGNQPFAQSMKKYNGVARGLLIAIPLVLVFGGLFAAADATFEHLLARIFHFKFEDVALHLLLIVIFTWLAAGLLRAAILKEESIITTINRPEFITLNHTEIGIALGALNLLFLVFVIIQLPHFFGGQAHVLATAGLTAADYARRGFFELVIVASLVLPLLILADWLGKEEDRSGKRLYRALSVGLILLTFLIIASAMLRMRLYHIGFGLTELRFYTTAFMGWLVVVFLWFAFTVLQGRKQIFMIGAFASGLLTLAIVDVINPDAFIVRANIDRLKAGKTFDGNYASSLSEDAVPELIKSWPLLNEENRKAVATKSDSQWVHELTSDWRYWNVSRMGAKRYALNYRQMMAPFITKESTTQPTSQAVLDGKE